jgi:hypothetical protein
MEKTDWWNTAATYGHSRVLPGGTEEDQEIYQDVIFPPELDVLLVLGTENAGVQEQFIILLADVALLSSAAIR